ncbi:MAG: glycosyltransferase, partial [Anaerolineae bacterium]
MPLHICVLTSVHRPFDGRIFHRQCVTLARAGYRVSLVAPAEFEQRVEAGVTVLGVPPAANRRERPRVWRHLFRQARRLRPDVIHFHDPELLLLVPLFRGRFGRRVKLVYDVHEYFADSLANKYWLPRPVRLAAPALARRAERALARGVDGIVCAVQAQTSLF